MNRNSGFSQIFYTLIFASFFVALLAGIYFYQRTKINTFGQLLNSNPVIPDNPIPVTSYVPQLTSTLPMVSSDWKTYKNDKYDFEFNYPAAAEPKQLGPNRVQQQLSQGKQISGTQAAVLETIEFDKLTPSLNINITKGSTKYPKAPEAVFIDGGCGSQFADSTLVNTTTQINSYNFRKLIQKNGTDYLYFYCTSNSKNQFIFKFTSATSSEPALVSQILSTFKLSK